MSQVERIEQALQRMMTDLSPEVREAASEAFDTVRARRSVDSYLQELRSGALEARIRAVYSASRIGGQEGVGLLLAALSDSEAEVRAVAARELAAYPTVPVLKTIVDQLPKEKGVVLGNLIESLGASRRKEIAPVIERYLADPNPEVKGKAIVAYARTAEDPWERVLPNAANPNDNVRASVARALAEWSGGFPAR